MRDPYQIRQLPPRHVKEHPIGGAVFPKTGQIRHFQPRAPPRLPDALAIVSDGLVLIFQIEPRHFLYTIPLLNSCRG